MGSIGAPTSEGHNVGSYDAFAPESVAGTQGYRITEVPLGTRRRMKVIILGAGVSGISFFKRAEGQLENVEIVCYEKNYDVGGTWLENRYPGVKCDIPSVNYQYSWKPQPWKHYYAGASEIWQYIKEIELENGFIDKYVKLRHEVIRAEWDEDKGVWRIKVRNLDTGVIKDDAAEIFINAGGVLNHWKWPDLHGLMDFEGSLVHSAAYDESLDLTGKRVAVVGAGSSGVQIVAAIQKQAKKLYTWVRSPIWVTAGFAQKFAGKDGSDFEYSEEQRRLLKENPKMLLEYRKMIENELNQRFKFIIKGTQEATEARQYSEEEMRRKLDGNPVLADKVIPKDFNVGCRRPTPGNGYLEALVAENTTCFTDPIDHVTHAGFVDHEGNEHEVDVIICATGFDTSWAPRFPFICQGRDLRDIWTPGNVTPYLSVGVPEFPNHFSFCGPYGPLAHGSFFPLIEQWNAYMNKVILKMQVENIKSLRPRQAAADQFRQHADAFLQRTAWTGPCRSWFKNGAVDGQVMIYPGSRLHFMELLETPRYEDYEIRYWNENKFAFLGNGFTTREQDGRDITYYLGLLNDDGVDKQPVYDEGLVDLLRG